MVIQRFQDNYAVFRIYLNPGAKVLFRHPQLRFLQEWRERQNVKPEPKPVPRICQDRKLTLHEALDRWHRFQQEQVFLEKEQVMAAGPGVNEMVKTAPKFFVEREPEANLVKIKKEKAKKAITKKKPVHFLQMSPGSCTIGEFLDRLRENGHF